MSMVIGGTALLSIGTNLYSGYQQGKAADKASKAQQAGTQAGIAENARQFDAMKELLRPYVETGGLALEQQKNLMGLGADGAQQKAIDAIEAGPQFTAMQQQGENSILQNASATGGLRGGNTQGALSQFRPQLLSQLINQQFQNLGGMANAGQNAAAGTGTAGMQSGAMISDLMQQQGAYKAGGYLANGATKAGYANALGSFAGNLMGAKF